MSDPNLEPLRWGILGASHFAKSATIPAMQKGKHTRVEAVASRSLEKAQKAAKECSIPKAYGSYDELLQDSELDAVYIPLSNNLHTEWTIKAARAGKHVLVEKPIALTAKQGEPLLKVQEETGVQIAEGFMIRYHPQWEKVQELIQAGRIGQVRAVQTAFSYANDDAGNIRNQKDVGGGALYDIGCYAISSARLAFGADPKRAIALVDLDPNNGTDRLTSALLDFEQGQASFVIGTKHVPYQRVQIFGTEGHIEVEIPFNAPGERPCRVLVGPGCEGAPDFTIAVDSRDTAEVIKLPVGNHYTLQFDGFSKAVRLGQTPRNTIAEALVSVRTIDAIFRSAESQRWESV